jgi:hypothetical protein
VKPGEKLRKPGESEGNVGKAKERQGTPAEASTPALNVRFHFVPVKQRHVLISREDKAPQWNASPKARPEHRINSA